MFQKRSLSNLLCLAASKLASATIHNVVMSDTDDFLTKLGLAEDHDTILLPPGNYILMIINEMETISVKMRMTKIMIMATLVK